MVDDLNVEVTLVKEGIFVKLMKMGKHKRHESPFMMFNALSMRDKIMTANKSF